MIGNIVSRTAVSVSDKFSVVKTLDEAIQGLPTLIVGWDIIKKQYPDYDITNRQITPLLFWTFKRTEKRDTHEEDLMKFVDFCYQNMVADVKYIYIDPLHFSRKKLFKICRKLLSSKNLASYFYGQMAYICMDYIIFGIDLKLLKHLGVDEVKLTAKIKAHSSHFLTGDEILIVYKDYIEKLQGKVRYVPFLYNATHDKTINTGNIHLP